MSEKGGRPSIHTQELADLICQRLASGESLRQICENDDEMPNACTVHLWVVQDRDGFSKQYADARGAQALRWADEILTIADDGFNDTYVDEKGNGRVDQDVVQRSRLRVDTRKWLLSKVLPKVYGDKVTLAGDDTAPLEVVIRRTVMKPDADS